MTKLTLPSKDSAEDSAVLKEAESHSGSASGVGGINPGGGSESPSGSHSNHTPEGSSSQSPQGSNAQSPQGSDAQSPQGSAYRKPQGSLLKRWGSFFLGVGCIVLFSTVIGPWLMNLPYARDVNKVIMDRGIDANTYFYTETPQFDDAEDKVYELMKDYPTPLWVILIGWALFFLLIWFGFTYSLKEDKPLKESKPTKDPEETDTKDSSASS